MTTPPTTDAPFVPPADTPTEPDASGFAALGLSDTVVAAVSALGYEEPTPIQREAIPILLSGRDVLGLAGTGTGKTAAFALPMLDVIAQKGPKHLGARGLVLVPTRELAMQVAEAIHKYAKGLGLTVVPLYGGAPMDFQIRALRRGAAFVVATPGRALDHLRRKTLDLSALRVLVLDEADEMLDMGFADDIEAILADTPTDRQTALFAATMAPRLEHIAARHMHNPERVSIAREKRPAGKVAQVRQVAYFVPRSQKITALGRVLDFENPKSAIVFCRTRLEVDELTDTLNAHGYSAKALHGGMEQKQRDRVMQMYRSEQADILVATDVAARGLDIDHVSHVVNFDVPTAPEVYVHRIGRTGRAGREGVAISLVDPRQHRLLRTIEAATKQKMEIAAVPSDADLHARRLDATVASLRSQLAAGGLEQARSVVDALAQEFDVLDIAAAAVRLIHDDGETGGMVDKETAGGSREKGAGKREGSSRASAGASREDRPARRDDRGTREAGAGPRERKPRESREREAGPARGRSAPGARVVLFLNVGKSAGVRPADLVGAITGEAGVQSSSLGSIRIADEHSLVEVPEDLANRIIVSLRAAKVRGRRVMVHRDDGRHTS